MAWEWYCTLGGRELRRAERCFWHPLGRYIDKCGDLAQSWLLGARHYFEALNMQTASVFQFLNDAQLTRGALKFKKAAAEMASLIGVK
jgi:hypothetical protein